MLFVHSASVEEGAEFFGEFWREARAVSDPEKFFYTGMGLKTGSLRELFGPGVWLRALRASRKGYSAGKSIGNPWLMPGIFIVRGPDILWKWKYRHIGDNPDFSTLPRFPISELSAG